MFGTIKNLTTENVFSMNEKHMKYLASYNNSVEIDYKLILQENSNFESFDSIYQSLKEIKGSLNTDDQEPADFRLLQHSVNSLKSVLLLTSKIINSINEINNIKSFERNKNKVIFQSDFALKQSQDIKNLAPYVFAFYDDFLLTYFESLLIQSQGLFDKLSILIQKYKIYNSSDENLIFEKEQQEALNDGSILSLNDFVATRKMKKEKTFYFSNLQRLIDRLSINNPNDVVYATIKREIDSNKTNLKDLIIAEGQKSLRNKIVHEESIITLSDNVFVVYRTKKGKILKFDSPILKNYPPVIESVDRILKSVPQMAINIISSIVNEKYNKNLKTDNQLSFKFVNTFIDFRKYELSKESTENKLKLNKFEFGEDGFTLQDFYYLKRSLFK